MKKAGYIIGIALIVLAVLVKNDPSFEPSVTFSLRAGQPFHFRTERSGAYRVHSQFPVSVSGDGCWSSGILDDTLQCKPGEILVTDMRPTLLVLAQPNVVTINYPLF